MSEQSPHILLVDDDPNILELLAISLDSVGYAITKAVDGKQALDHLQAQPLRFQAIVSDVSMPQMNGYELCETVRGNPETAVLPFIFISGLTTLEEKLKGYGVGGDEYITKPIEPAEVILKIQNIIENKIRHLNISKQLQESQAVAMQAMTYTSNLGQVLQFLQVTQQCETYQQLAENIFTVTESFGLQCNLQFYTPQGIIDITRKGKVPPLEANIVEMSHNKGRFFDFGPRTTVNYDDFSILVKNMPTDNPEKYGLIKDLLGNLCDAIQTRTKFLLTSRRIERKDSLVAAVNKTIDEVDQTFHFIQRENTAAIDSMMNELEDAMLTSLGLSEAQEDVIRKIAERLRERSQANFQLAEGLYEQFQDIHAQLELVLK